MSGQKLETTHRADYQPLVLASQTFVFETLGQIRLELEKLSPEHALIFAEPNADPASGDIEWYAPLPGPATRLSALPPAEANAARNRLAQLVTDISNHVEELRKSGKSLMAHNLDFALEIPDEEHIHVIDGHPVLALWGHVPMGPAVPQRRLQKFANEVIAQAPALPGSTVPDHPDDDPVRIPPVPPTAISDTRRYQLQISSIPVMIDGRTNWASVLLWLAFLLLLLLIGYLLLKYCALALPGGMDPLRRVIFNYCDPPSIVAVGPPADDAGRRRLLDTLASLETELANKRNACTVDRSGPRSPDPSTRSPPEETALNPPPTDRPPEDTIGLVEQRGGKIGDVNVVLRWNTKDDLDLHIHCPDGSIINFKIVDKAAVCGGALDVDANFKDKDVVTSPAENVTWPERKAAPGDYVVKVNRYKDRTGSQSTPFTVELFINREPMETHEGVAEDTTKDVFTFTLPYVRR